MHRSTAIAALLASLALVMMALTFPAYADPGNGNGPHASPPANGGSGAGNNGVGNGNSNGNGVGQNGSPPGNNGTIKVHNGDSEPGPLVENEPQENETKIEGCTFHIHGFNFDSASTGTWTIVAWPPSGDGTTVVASGTWSASSSGDWRTAVMSLASGHYKAFAKQTGSPGGEKQKAFWIQCGAGAASTPTPAAATAAPTSTPTTGGATATATPTPTQLGFQQPPAGGGAMGGVSPIVETGTAPAPVTVAGQQQGPAAPGQIAGQQQPVSPQGVPETQQAPMGPATIAGLPSTSTSGAGAPSLVALIAPLAVWIRRAIRR